ncbi:MAG TPA: hydroxysqualene dehydroxylase HpnE [Bryobacteraceae bacterium]|nr:hydroxysqualene dehydroxylase HpnE [Bryobacteraceae bacterium]
MPEIIVAGGGLAGLAATAALCSAGHSVKLFEARPFLGGRATSYEIDSETIDNCQHILLRCCVNLMDFYRRLGVENDITFHREIFFIEPGGRTSTLRAGILPAPNHFAESFLRMSFLSAGEKLDVLRAIRSIKSESTRTDLDRITMLEWLEEKRQPARAIERFWRQVLVSAINEELDRMAAVHGLQVFRLGFLARKNSYEMGVPAVPLGRLYGNDAWARIGQADLKMRAPIEKFVIENGSVDHVVAGGEQIRADHYVCALPFERVGAIIPDLPLDLAGFEHSPITGIHLWFDRPVTTLPHATLLDRTIQWMFNKSEGRYIQLVVSASRSLETMPRADVIALALRELADFFPAVRDAKLEKSHVVKEIRATFSAAPGLESRRPLSCTSIPNLFLAGDWTRSGWPATMEGAVRSGYLAAEAITGKRFLLPDTA